MPMIHVSLWLRRPLVLMVKEMDLMNGAKMVDPKIVHRADC